MERSTLVDSGGEERAQQVERDRERRGTGQETDDHENAADQLNRSGQRDRDLGERDTEPAEVVDLLGVIGKLAHAGEGDEQPRRDPENDRHQLRAAAESRPENPLRDASHHRLIVAH